MFKLTIPFLESLTKINFVLLTSDYIFRESELRLGSIGTKIVWWVENGRTENR